MRDPEIIDIDGKHYIELPCKPGDALYHVHIFLDVDNENNCIKSNWRISPITFYTVAEIIRNLDMFGLNVFLTREDAEVELNKRITGGEWK